MAYHYDPNKRELSRFSRNTDPVSLGIVFCILAAVAIIILHTI